VRVPPSALKSLVSGLQQRRGLGRTMAVHGDQAAPDRRPLRQLCGSGSDGNSRRTREVLGVSVTLDTPQYPVTDPAPAPMPRTTQADLGAQGRDGGPPCPSSSRTTSESAVGGCRMGPRRHRRRDRATDRGQGPFSGHHRDSRSQRQSPWQSTRRYAPLLTWQNGTRHQQTDPSEAPTDQKVGSSNLSESAEVPGQRPADWARRLGMSTTLVG